MATPHFVVFIGATPALSNQLTRLGKRKNLIMLAPAMRKGEFGINRWSLEKAHQALYDVVAAAPDHGEWARLSVWAYEPDEPEAIARLWTVFGRSAWVELLPARLRDLVPETDRFVEGKLAHVEAGLDQISAAVYHKKSSSPLSLSFANFDADFVTRLTERYWYRGKSIADVQSLLKKFGRTFNDLRSSEEHAFRDRRGLLFQPAENTVLHGKSHPNASSAQSFIKGRFRFGAALFPGFHYDVRADKNRLLNVTLTDSEGNRRDLRPEKREYINVFPNDHLLPAQSKTG